MWSEEVVGCTHLSGHVEGLDRLAEVLAVSALGGEDDLVDEGEREDRVARQMQRGVASLVARDDGGAVLDQLGCDEVMEAILALRRAGSDEQRRQTLLVLRVRTRARGEQRTCHADVTLFRSQVQRRLHRLDGEHIWVGISQLQQRGDDGGRAGEAGHVQRCVAHILAVGLAEALVDVEVAHATSPQENYQVLHLG